MAEKTGLENNIFYIESWNKERESRKVIKTVVSSVRNTWKKVGLIKRICSICFEQSNQTDIEMTESTPLISETGEPVFVIIEIKLFRPLVPCRLEADFSDM